MASSIGEHSGATTPRGRLEFLVYRLPPPCLSETAAFDGVVRSDRLRFAEAAGGDGGGRDALLGEKIADGIGAVVGELLIEFVAAHAVRVAFDLQREAGMREDNPGNFG